MKSSVAVKLGPGEHFGEMALFREERWGASVVALTFCELHILHFYDFKELERDYTAEMGTMRKFAEARNMKKESNDIMEMDDNENEKNTKELNKGDKPGASHVDENQERVERLEHRLQILESRIAARAENLEQQLIRIISGKPE